ncbi:TonB-dependent receptor plug domain-containing protein [Marinicauda algicola]|nr:TonB-dependent receptor [Marinicauda algicola]
MALRARLTATAGLCLALALSPAAVASDTDAGMESALARTEPEPAADGAIVQYPAGFFTQFSPVTARDMIARVPGFALSAGNTQRRGLADSFGNLLVDGRRPSNKSLGLERVLERIPASDVERIEIIREALPDYDMRGHAQLANVILREGAGRAVNWNGQISHYSSGRVLPDAGISYSDRVGETEFTLAVEGELRGPRIERDEQILSPQRDLLFRLGDEEQRRFWRVNPSLSVASPVGEDGRVRLDLEAEHWNWRRLIFTDIERPAGGGFVPAGAERSETVNFGNVASANLAYVHALTETVELETTLYAQHHDFEDGPERFEEFDASGALSDATIVLFEGEVGERALRQSLSWTPNQTHALDFSIEGAFNYRDTLLELFSDNGVVVAPIPLPVSDARVEERRGELSANHVWSVRPEISLESGLRYEVSEITQTGDVNQQRSFTYLKPSVVLVWTPAPNTRWRIAGLRDVDQLQFQKFASAVNLTDNVSVIGNPDYRPQNTWTIEAEWERRFGEEASVSLTVGRDWIKDLDDFIAVVTPNGVFDAPGNIGDGDRRRVTLEWSSPLDALGLDNAVLDGFVEWYGTEVTDPLTGEERAFSGIREWEMRFDFRQTFPEAGWAWGWDYFWLSDGEVFRARELRHEAFPDGDLDVYVETTRFAGLTTRLGADFVFDTPSHRERIFFDGSRASGVVRMIETRDEYQGTTIYLQVRGTL